MDVLGNALNKFQEQINHLSILTHSKHISFNVKDLLTLPVMYHAFVQCNMIAFMNPFYFFA